MVVVVRDTGLGRTGAPGHTRSWSHVRATKEGEDVDMLVLIVASSSVVVLTQKCCLGSLGMSWFDFCISNGYNKQLLF